MKRAKVELGNEGDTLVMAEESAIPVYGHKRQLWDLNDFLDGFSVLFVHESDDGMDVEFDLAYVGASIANAIRRVLIAEVPSMAIEKVFLYQNTSVIPDEVLCHRLGLLPISANPFHFNFPPHRDMTDEERDKSNDLDEEPAGDPKENLIFEIHVKCKKKKSSSIAAAPDDMEKLYENSVVRTKSFKWIPIGKQGKLYAENPLRIVHDDIVIAKMRPGQEIEARCHCVKGIGRDHAKFSPVATASYRMLPEIRITRTVLGEPAERLKNSFSDGVIGIDRDTGVAYVRNARKDTCSRNIFQHDDIKDAVQMTKNTDYFIFSVESTGAMKGRELTQAAMQVIRAKLRRLHGLVKEKLDGVRKRT